MTFNTFTKIVEEIVAVLSAVLTGASVCFAFC